MLYTRKLVLSEISLLEIVEMLFAVVYFMLPVFILYVIRRYVKKRAKTHYKLSQQWFVTGILILLLEMKEMPKYPGIIWGIVSSYKRFNDIEGIATNIAYQVITIIFIIIGFYLGFHYLKKGKIEFKNDLLLEDKFWFLSREPLKLAEPIAYAMVIATILTSLEGISLKTGLNYLVNTNKDSFESVQFFGLLFVEQIFPIVIIYLIYHYCRRKTKEPLLRENRWLMTGVILILLNLRYFHSYLLMIIGVVINLFSQSRYTAGNLYIITSLITISFAVITFAVGYRYLVVGQTSHSEEES